MNQKKIHLQRNSLRIKYEELTKQIEVILLGAGPSQIDVAPKNLSQANKSSKVLDWLLAASKHYPKRLLYCGYNIDEITKQYPSLNVKINERWVIMLSHFLLQRRLKKMQHL